MNSQAEIFKALAEIESEDGLVDLNGLTWDQYTKILSKRSYRTLA